MGPEFSLSHRVSSVVCIRGTPVSWNLSVVPRARLTVTLDLTKPDSSHHMSAAQIHTWNENTVRVLLTKFGGLISKIEEKVVATRPF